MFDIQPVVSHVKHEPSCPFPSLQSFHPIIYEALQQQGNDDHLPLPNRTALIDISDSSLSLSLSLSTNQLMVYYRLVYA